MNDQISLYTDRLILKSITPAIIHALFNSCSKEEILTYFGTDDAGFERMKGMHEKGMETDRLSLCYFLLHRKENGQPIGDCGFHTWNKFHRRAEIFYFLNDDNDKRQGYMTEALPIVLDYGFEELGLHRIEARVAKMNTPSIRLLDRFNFAYEGTMREDYVVDGENQDSDCYSLLKHEWGEQF